MKKKKAAARRRIALERTLRASIEDVWALWTTKDGLESWWGPDGFTVTVKKLDLRPGGELLYDMAATAAPQIAFMKQAGMPLATPCRLVFEEVTPPRRLVYVHRADFIPGVEPYDVEHVVELTPGPEGVVKLVLTIEAMHDDEWTGRAVSGWENELGWLEEVLGGVERKR